MNKLEQFYRLHQLFDGRRTPIGVSALADRLDCSSRTVRRYIEEFQDFWRAPLVHVPRKGWMYDRAGRDRWEVPGLWMTTEECQSLTLLLDILSRFGNGLLNDELKGVRASIDQALAQRGISRAELEARIRIIPIGQRLVPERRLQQILNGLVQRERLRIRYRDFQLELSTRTVSPQRLVYYRDNWYMDGWCHKSDGLRTFSLARVEHCQPTDERATVIPQESLDREFTHSYGVFAGHAANTAVLRFRPQIALEISRQEWHPEQAGRFDGDDYVLQLPYADDRELIQDIMRYSPYVVVESPSALRERVAGRLRTAMALYETTG